MKTERLAFPEVIAQWGPQLFPLLEAQVAVAFGVFAIDGTPLFLNAGMSRLLVGNAPVAPGESLQSRFLSPSFSSLRFSRPGQEQIHVGVLTFGDQAKTFSNVTGEVWRREQQLFVFGAYDVIELEEINRRLGTLNNEVSNLQRTLSLEKLNLERALGELRETQAMLIQSEKMSALGQLVAGVAHEINNPIAFVASNLFSMANEVQEIFSTFEDIEDLIREEGNPVMYAESQDIRREAKLDFLLEDLQEMLRSSQDGLDRVKKIVEDLRTFARTDENALQRTDVAENLRSTLSLARPELKKKRVQVHTSFAELPLLLCDPGQLNQCFLNLLINGIQAIEQKGYGPRCIEIETRDEGECVAIIFTDTGIGMSEELKAKIFHPFFTSKPVGSGTGLGLSVVYNIVVECHRGRIEVESRPGEGSSFTLHLPKEVSDGQP